MVNPKICAREIYFLSLHACYTFACKASEKKESTKAVIQTRKAKTAKTKMLETKLKANLHIANKNI